jgi:hypothetical protein
LRVTLPSVVSGELFLNGSRVAAFDNGAQGRSRKKTQTLDLGPRATAVLVEGENVLTARLEGAKSPIPLALAAGPGIVEKRPVASVPPDHGNNNRNGWIGTFEQHRRSVAWAFEGKSPEQIARYLPFPDWNGSQAAYQALAAHGAKAVPLLTRLVADSHAGIRVGAWDALGDMDEKGLLSDEAKKTFSALAASRIAGEEPTVGQALGRAAAPMAKGEDLAAILAGIATMPDIKARELATNIARKRLADRPDLMIKVLTLVAAGGLDNGDIRVLGGAMGGISRHAELPEA